MTYNQHLLSLLLGYASPCSNTKDATAKTFFPPLSGSQTSRTTGKTGSAPTFGTLGLANSLLGPLTPRPKTLADINSDAELRKQSDVAKGHNTSFGGLGFTNPLLTGTAPARRATILTATEPVRRAYFSFHYQRDIQRAQRVKNHWVTKGTHRASGFFDNSLEEKAKTNGDYALKRLINSGMRNSSVTCLLIGAETWSRRWVRYEIFRSVAEGRGVFGVRIHNMKNLSGWTDYFGGYPFAYMGYVMKPGSSKLWPVTYDGLRWSFFDLADPIDITAAKYLRSQTNPRLDSLFPVYDWVLDDGYSNFASWVARAARHAGR